MRVLVRHGHFAFYPRKAGDIGNFANSFQLELEREEDYYTFSFLKDAPRYSIVGSPYLGLPATKTYEGMPWEVMRENGFVYSLGLERVVPKASVTGITNLNPRGFFYIADGSLIQPGARITGTTGQVLSYSGELFDDIASLRVLEFSNE